MSRFSPDERIDTVKLDLDCLTERVIDLEQMVRDHPVMFMTHQQFQERVKKIVDAQLATR